MWKKIILGVLFGGLIAVLLVGAVTRTNSKTGSTNDRSVEQARDQKGQSQGNQGDGNGDASSDSTGIVWESLQGSVIDVTESELLLKSDSGDQVLVEGRAWSYVQDQGFLVQNDDLITVTGFYENDELKVSAIDNITSGQSITIRESNGRPMWAGGGRGGE